MDSITPFQWATLILGGFSVIGIIGSILFTTLKLSRNFATRQDIIDIKNEIISFRQEVITLYTKSDERFFHHLQYHVEKSESTDSLK